MRVATILCIVVSVVSVGRLRAADPIEGWPGPLAALHGGSYLGVGIAEVSDQRAQQLKLKEVQGVEVTQVEPASPAAQAGIRANDVLLTYNKEEIEGVEQFGRLVRETPAGRRVTLELSRDGKIQDVSVVVGERKFQASVPEKAWRFEMPSTQFAMPSMPDMPNPAFVWHSGMLGIECEGIDSQFAEYFGVKQGVLVRFVRPDSPAQKAGLKAGDVLTRVGSKPVTTPREVTMALHSEEAPGKPVTIHFMRDHSEHSLDVTVDQARAPVPVPQPHAISAPVVKP